MDTASTTQNNGGSTNTPANSEIIDSLQALSSRQIKMKKIGKKLLGNKRAGKLFRLGLQQITANQPEYFLLISKKFISQGQYSKAFNLLRKQIYKPTIQLEYKPSIMHQYTHVCYKIMENLIKSKFKEQQDLKESERDSFSLFPANNPKEKKKTNTSRIEKLNAIIEIQFKNLSDYEEALAEIIQNYEQNVIENSKQNLKVEAQKRYVYTSNYESMQNSSASELNSPQLKGESFSQDNNEDVENIKKTESTIKTVDIQKIEMYKEIYLKYFLKTMILCYKHFKQEEDNQMALYILKKACDFIHNFIDRLFGDFINLDIYRLSGDILQIKANILYESQNIESAIKLYDRAFNYYRFAGQIILKKFHSKSSNQFDSLHELKSESIYSSLSVNVMMQAQCFEHLQNYERILEALQVSNWINKKLLIYDFSDKLRNHVYELLLEAKQKYSVFLEEKGEIRRVLIQAFPDLEILEKKLQEKNQKNSILYGINNYLYEKENAQELNSTLYVLQRVIIQTQILLLFIKKQFKNYFKSNMTLMYNKNCLIKKQECFGFFFHKVDKKFQWMRFIDPVLQTQFYHKFYMKQYILNLYYEQKPHMNQTKENMEQNPQALTVQDGIQNDNNTSQRNFTTNAMTSPERVKDSDLQSFTDLYNYNNSTQISNANQTTGHGNNSTTIYANQTQFSYQNGYNRQTQQGHYSCIHLNHSPRGQSGVSNNSLYQTGTASVMNQNSKMGNSLFQINENVPENREGSMSVRRHISLQVTTDDMASNMMSTKPNTQPQTSKYDKKRGNISQFSKRNSSGHLVIRSNKNTHEQPAPIYMKGHSDLFKPKMLTTNKYFQPETYKSKTNKTITDFRDIISSCQEQEKKFHYLNLQPIKLKSEKNQGVLSLDYAMENLIKEKIIESEVQNIQNTSKNQTQTPQIVMTEVNNSPTSSKMSNSQPKFFTNKLKTQNKDFTSKSPVYSDIQMMNISPFSNLNPIDKNNQSTQENSKMDKFCDKTVGTQIRNLMESLSISPEDQKLIIQDLSAKFEAEKRSLFSSTQKNNKSKVSQQGWTTEKILQELLKSINILGENVNMYNQRFSYFLSTIKDEDFDKSEFYTCLKKLQFKQRMGNGIIPEFFRDREQPVARIQERRKIDDEFQVAQGGGERMLEIMSDHKIIKNLFIDEGNSNDPPNKQTNQKDGQQPKEVILVNSTNDLNSKSLNRNKVTYKTALSILQNQKRSSSTLENKNTDDMKSDLTLKPTYKQKQKRVLTAKTNTLQDIHLLNSSESNVEKLNMFGYGQAKKIDYFQKSQELLRQMVLKSEQDCEVMQKAIMYPKRNEKSLNSQKNLTFTNFTNKLAISTSKYTQKEKIKKSGNKMDFLDFMRIQNKWRQKAHEKNGAIITNKPNNNDISNGENSPMSTLTMKFKKASRNFLLANAISNSQSMYAYQKQ